MTVGISFLRATELAAFAGVTGASRQGMHPLLQFFPREDYGTDTIKIRVEVARTRLAQLHGWDEPVKPGKGNDLREIEAEPGLLKEGRELTNKEESFFRAWNQLIEQNQVPGEAQSAKRARMINTITRDSMIPVEEMKHHMCQQALAGSLQATLNGNTQTINYGLTSLSAPGTVWSNAGAKIASDIFGGQEEFLDNADVPPDTVFFNRKLFSQYLSNNTDWLSYIKENPQLAAAFAGFDSAALRFQNVASPIFMFGMLWVPVEGKYEDSTGTKQDRWPVNGLTFCAMRPPDGQVPTEWAAVRNKYTPNARPAFRVFEESNPMQTIVEYADTGIPVIRLQERVMPVTVT